MSYKNRLLQKRIQNTLHRGKSILLLGARQTGKTTLLKEQCQPDIYYNFASPAIRRAFETNPDSLSQEIDAFRLSHPDISQPLIIIDEVQKVPAIMDVAQYIIDEQRAQLILTGSSARQLKQHKDINLLPGRVIKLQLDALNLIEINTPTPKIESLLLYGSLPEVFLEKNNAHREEDLLTYVNIYLEEEIRQEALVRNLPAFTSFLELIAIEAGTPINMSKLSQDVGVSTYTINEYLNILQDCLIIEKINPITATHSRRRLTKAAKYLFFDLGVRRICAKEGILLSQKMLGQLFEQFIGIEIARYIRASGINFKLSYWRDHSGAEIDYILDMHHTYLPIEVKWTDNPNTHDCRHIHKFLNEYPCHDIAYIICRTPRKRMLSERVMALPWQDLPEIYTLITAQQ